MSRPRLSQVERAPATTSTLATNMAASTAKATDSACRSCFQRSIARWASRKAVRTNPMLWMNVRLGDDAGRKHPGPRARRPGERGPGNNEKCGHHDRERHQRAMARWGIGENGREQSDGGEPAIFIDVLEGDVQRDRRPGKAGKRQKRQAKRGECYRPGHFAPQFTGRNRDQANDERDRRHNAGRRGRHRHRYRQKNGDHWAVWRQRVRSRHQGMVAWLGRSFSRVDVRAVPSVVALGAWSRFGDVGQRFDVETTSQPAQMHATDVDSECPRHVAPVQDLMLIGLGNGPSARAACAFAHTVNARVNPAACSARTPLSARSFFVHSFGIEIEAWRIRGACLVAGERHGWVLGCGV